MKMDDDQEQQDQEERKRAEGRLFWVILLPLLGVIGYGIWVRFFPPVEEIPTATPNAFNLPEAPKANIPPPAVEPAKPDPDLVASQLGHAERPATGLPLPEPRPPFPAPKAAAPAGRAGEQEFLKKHGAQLLGYQKDVLSPIGRKYRRKVPIVLEVDRAFGRLPRYMELVKQYRQDGDAYKWARGVIVLPEVRKTIMHYALTPEVWKVGMQMSLEAMKNPPPKPIYDETQRFMTTDPQMSEFVGEFSMQILPMMSRMLAQAVTPGTDLSPLQNLASQLAPPNLKPALGKQPASPGAGKGTPR